MYSEPFKKGDAVPIFALMGVCENGTRIRIDPLDLNFDIWEFWKGPVAAAQEGDVATLHGLIDPMVKRKGIRLKSLELSCTPYRIADEGVERRPDAVLKSFDWEAAR